jgi:hypothetical protein
MRQWLASGNSIVSAISAFSIAREYGYFLKRLMMVQRRALEAHTGIVPPDAYGPFHIQRLLQVAFHETTR